MARPDLKRGDQGDDVRYLQERLEEHLRNDGIRLSAVDGDFGPITEESVIHFQRIHDLPDDGIVGERTWELLEQQPGSTGSGSSSGSSSGSQTPGVPTTLRMRPQDVTIPYRLTLPFQDTTLDLMNQSWSNFDLRSHQGAQLSYLQPVGRLFGNGGIEALNLEVKTWPNWFLTWSIQAVAEWDRNNGLVIGANNHGQLGVRPLRGVEIVLDGNLNLRIPVGGDPSIKATGGAFLRLNILELLP
jgi:hypothetical protein